MSKIALIGAAGAIGKSIVAALRNQGREYRVVGRNRAALERDFGADPLAEIVTWNPNEPESVRLACRGVDTLVYLVGVPYNQFELHPQLMQKTLDGAVAEGVEKFALVGTVYPYGRSTTPKVAEDHPRNPHTFKGRMRKEQEDILMRAHAEGKIQATILVLPDFYGPGVDKSFLHGLFQASLTGKTADMIGPIDRPHQFVFVPDVGPILLALARKPEAYGKRWNFAGSGITTQKEIVERVAKQTGRRPNIRVAGKTLLRIVGLFNPIMREMVEMHYLVTDPVLLDDSALRKLIPDLKATSYDEGVRQSLKP